MQKKHLALVIMLAVLLVFAAGCSGASKSLTAVISKAPLSLDPQLSTSGADAVYITHLFETLTTYGEANNSRLDAAAGQSFKISQKEMPDGKNHTVYTFVLRPSKWTDGQAVTAHDFVYAMQRLVDPLVASPYALDMGSFLYNGEAIVTQNLAVTDLGVTAIDDNTLEIVLQNDCSYFLDVLAANCFAPVRKDIVSANPAWATSATTLVSNGSYKLTEWTPDAQMVLSTNGGYWNAINIKNSKLTFRLTDQENAIIEAVRANEVQYAQGYPGGHLLTEQLYRNAPVLGTTFLSFNTQKAPFSNASVREALFLSVDHLSLANTTLSQQVTPATGLLPDGFIDFNGNRLTKTEYRTSDYATNSAAAKAALALAGFPNGAGFPATELLVPRGSENMAVANALVAMWKNVLNIDITVVAKDASALETALAKGEFTLAQSTLVANYKDPLSLLSPFATKSLRNPSKFTDPAFDQALQTARTTIDAAHFAALADAESILMADYACVPLYHNSISSLQPINLTGQRTGSLGIVYLGNAYIDGKIK